jgi:two-component system cell cycle response regulator
MSDETIIAKPEDFNLTQAQKRRRSCLVQYSGSQLGKIYYIEDPTVIIGRNAGHPIMIQDPSVSRNHVKLTKQGEEIWAEDLGSSNGTFVNDAKINGQVCLNDRDMLQIGNIVLKYCASDNLDVMIQDKIYRMATIDAGTQIYNKQYLMDALSSEVRYAKNTHRPLSIIYYDLDHFKKVNDNYGHNAGDVILKESAALVKSIVRKDDIFGRFGGEEFVIVLPNTDKTTAAEMAERVRKGMESHVFNLEVQQENAKQTIQHRQTVSLGVSELEPQIKAATDFLESADQKLYNSKQTGRNRVTV